MHESKYSKAGFHAWLNLSQRANAIDPRLRPVMRAFAANVGRIESMWMLLPYLVDTATNSTAMTVRAVHNLFGTTDLLDPAIDWEQSEEKFHAEFQRLCIENELRIGDENTLQRALQRLDQVLDNSPQPFIKNGVETVLIGQITNTWTAVEILMKDLWETALNHGDARWVSKLMKSKGLQETKEQEKSIPVTTLHKFSFDLSKKMGTVMKDKIRFETVAEVLAAYSSVFGDEFLKIFPEKSIPLLETLEATRNVFAHRGGLVDAKFIKTMKRLAPGDVFTEKVKLKVDGVLAGNLAINGISFCLATINYVAKQFEEKEPDYQI
jgi:hypothetical protein